MSALQQTPIAEAGGTGVARSARPRLSLVPDSCQSAPTFSWDAQVDLADKELTEHRLRFPRSVDLSPLLCDLPDAGAWGANLAVGIMEIALRQRPAAQLERWVVPGLFQAFCHAMSQLTLSTTRRSPVRVTQYRTCGITERISECCIIVDIQGRRRTVSLRLEGCHGKWIATALQIL